jgi:hypothetical protein
MHHIFAYKQLTLKIMRDWGFDHLGDADFHTSFFGITCWARSVGLAPMGDVIPHAPVNKIDNMYACRRRSCLSS